MEKLVNGQVLNYLSTNSLLYEHLSGFLAPQTLNRDQALLLVKPVANSPWERRGNSRSVLGFKQSLWPCLHTWITLQIIFSGLHRFHNAMVYVLPDKQRATSASGWMPVIATGPHSVWHPARDGPGPFSWCISTICPDLYTKWMLDIRGWHLYVQDGS